MLCDVGTRSGMLNRLHVSYQGHVETFPIATGGSTKVKHIMQAWAAKIGGFIQLNEISFVNAGTGRLDPEMPISSYFCNEWYVHTCLSRE